MKSKKRDWVVLLLFFFLVFLLRLPSLSQSAFGPDEGLYLLMARSFIEGQPPYTEIWDNKPIGIYVLFSLALLVFGKSVLSIRIIACFAVTITSYLLYRLGSVFSNDRKVGLLAGILYTLLSLRNGGLSSNTEVFYATFVVCAFYLLFATVVNPTQRIRHNFSLFAAGLAMGLGFQIKQVVIFEFIAILLIVGLHLYSQTLNKRRFVTQLCQDYVFLGLGFFLPFLPIILYFTVTGHFADYSYANFTANVSRISDESISFNDFATSFLIQVKSNLILWACLLLIPLYWVASKETNLAEKRNLTYLLIWVFMSFLGVCSPKSFLTYYFLQLLPSLCLLSSYVIIKTVWTRESTMRNLLNLALILVVPFLSILYPYLKVGIKSVYFRYLKGVDNWGDEPAIISKYLRERVTQQDYIYVADYQPIIYYLVPAKIPTKYALPAFLSQPKLSEVAGIDAIQELSSIMEKKPVYIIRIKQQNAQPDQSRKFYTELNEYLRKYYVLDKEFPNAGDIFESIDDISTVQLYKLKT